MADDGKWMRSAVRRPGAFKAKAKSAGTSVGGMVRKVLKKGAKFSARTKKQAVLARTFARFRPK